MIVYRKGDVLDAYDNCEIDYVIHGCNSKGVMGAGIAKQIKTKYPVAFSRYLADDIRQVGSYTKHKGIINLITQVDYLPRNIDHFEYEAFEDGLKNILEETQGAVGMPMIGAGLAGGDWHKIEAIINRLTPNRDIFVYILD